MTHYSISVELLEADTSDGTNNNRAAEPEKWRVYYEAAKAEYDYSVDNSSKLDGKAYTLLTVCAFLFTALYTVMGQVRDFFVWCGDKGCWGYLGIAILSVILLWACFYLSRAIFLLVNVLNISKTLRVNINELLQKKDIFMENYEDTLKRFTVMYAACTQAGTISREERHEKLARSIKAIYVALYAILIILAVLLSGFVVQSVKHTEQVHLQYTRILGERSVSVMETSNYTSKDFGSFLSDTVISFDDAITNFIKNREPMPQFSVDAIRNSNHVTAVSENGDIFSSSN